MTNMRKTTLKERFAYWFDNLMSKGSMGLIGLLLVFSLLTALLISGLIMLLGFGEEQGFFSIIWDVISTIINAWMPYSGDGGVGYLILTALAALAGLLVTSVLIGIFSSAIEEKIVGLRKGNSPVLEEGHIVLLGFYPGEYTLLNQLILGAKDRETVIVIGAEGERDETEECIRENLEVPENVRVICRSVDPFDARSIEKLSIATCRTVIISPTDDERTVKMILAVSSLLEEERIDTVRVNAIIAKEENRFPAGLALRHNIITLQANDTMAKLMARSCTQTGLSVMFREIFDFEGSELYLTQWKNQEGLLFSELLTRLDGGVPIGIYRQLNTYFNPKEDVRLNKDDKILVYALSNDSTRILEKKEGLTERAETKPVKAEKDTKVTIFGNKSSLKTILRQLPENVKEATLVNYDLYNYEMIQKICQERGLKLVMTEGNLRDENELYGIVKDTEHVIIQSNYGDEEEADTSSIFLLLNLREIRDKYSLHFNITSEMRREKNQKLIETQDRTDFIIASNMSSLFLAQLAASPLLIDAFREILDNQGNELYMKQAGDMNCAGKVSIRQLRQRLYARGYIFLGFMRSNGEYSLNPPLEEEVDLSPLDSLIVFGEN